uniref:Carboxylic ester hydrolase n=1 Tax=Sphenodon punctatus TaxID=8508 RepID=A0A8D0HG69_SPHPU
TFSLVHSCLFIFYLALPHFLDLACGANDTIVLTSSGPIHGTHLPAGSGSVTAFLGIPYAQPPVGKLRFKKPLPHEPWSDILEATKFGNSCHQIEVSSYHEEDQSTIKMPQSEDCLFLNVWVPHPRPHEPVPILVWIHGGGFSFGSGSNDRGYLAATENIIVASMNYRLGALGFLSLPPAAPGNAGLWDQNLALRWLKENAAAFGGDPSRLTVSGQSAGGASVGFHLLSPQSQPLFARAVLQSGAATCPWAWHGPEEAKQRGRALGRVLGCAEGNDTAVVSCLRGKDPAMISRLQTFIRNPKDLMDAGFVPTTDGDFLLEAPQKLLESGRFPAVPILTGFTTDEGSVFLDAAPGFSLDSESIINREQLLEGLRLLVPKAPESTVQAAALLYSQEKRGPARYRDAMVKASTDYLFLCPVAGVAGWLAETRSAVYAYVFTHRPPFITAPDWIGVPHCAELPYLFAELPSVAEDEWALSHRVIRYWAEFARSGFNPTADGSGEQWPLYNSKEQNFFRISTEPPQVQSISPSRHCHFWGSGVTEEINGE